MNLRDSFATFPRDFVAGTVVFLVALPLCLGIANASGVEPFAGLVSGIVGGLVVAALSGSRLSVSGPAAGLVVIVADGIAQLGTFSAFLLAVLLSGVIQFGFGMLKAGRFAAYVPSPVIKGMLAAIGLLLIIKQLPLALGLFDPPSMPFSAVAGVATPLGHLSVAACVITLALARNIDQLGDSRATPLRVRASRARAARRRAARHWRHARARHAGARIRAAR
jgi:MFS superfamily sulfate permease-like transporter